MRPLQLWIDTLRGRNYAQTKHSHPFLKENDGYTAVGVLCELARESGVIVDYEPARAMPWPVQRWVRLRFPYCLPFTLDDDGRTFSATADLLEKNQQGFY